MNVLVVYHSRTQRTQVLAEEVARGAASVDGVEVRVRSTTEVVADDFSRADAVIAGSPVYFGTMAAELKKVFDDFIALRKKMENKVGAAFASGGSSSECGPIGYG